MKNLVPALLNANPVVIVFKILVSLTRLARLVLVSGSEELLKLLKL